MELKLFCQLDIVDELQAQWLRKRTNDREARGSNPAGHQKVPNSEHDGPVLPKFVTPPASGLDEEKRNYGQ